MEELHLRLVGPEDRAFHPYVPGNLRPLLGREGTVCVGAAYGAAACGAALAQRDRGGGYDLRYICVDPAARLCGLGTYLLRGLLGQLRTQGAREVRAIYTPGMLEGGGQTWASWSGRGFPRRSRCPRASPPGWGTSRMSGSPCRRSWRYAAP